MFSEGIAEYKEIISEKLKALERKLELSCVGVSDDKKLASVYRDIHRVRTDTVRLNHGEISWDDLKIYNIFKSQIEKTAASRRLEEAEIKTKLADFNALSEVPIKEHSAYVDSSINELYSMVEFINNNYMSLFTQKVLLHSIRNSAARENIYQHYQELVRLFNHYIDFAASGTGRGGRLYNDDLLHKEYVSIFKKYHAFINSLRFCIDSIQQDETITPEDFGRPLTNMDPNMRIFGLTFQVALEECKNFVNEVEEYMTFVNRDFFDAMDIDNKNK